VIFGGSVFTGLKLFTSQATGFGQADEDKDVVGGLNAGGHNDQGSGC